MAPNVRADGARMPAHSQLVWWLSLIAVTVAAFSGAAIPAKAFGRDAGIGQERENARKWISGFYVGYQSELYPPERIDFSSLSHVMVFSVLPNNDGSLDTSLWIDPTNGPKLARDVAQRAHAAGKKAILTVGGEETGTRFQTAASPPKLTLFAQNLISLIDAWSYDGIDIDWEPLTPSDYPLVVLLIEELRKHKPDIIITVDINWVNTNLPLTAADAAFYQRLVPLVDQMNIMTYGMAADLGDWVSWHSSALFGHAPTRPTSVKASVDAYLQAGVPRHKLGIGIGFYGMCWHSPITGPLQGLGNGKSLAEQRISFSEIMNIYFEANRRFYDHVAQAAYLAFPDGKGPASCTFISYEDQVSIAAKANYIAEEGLGGAIIWQLNQGYDAETRDSSLLRAVAAAIGLAAYTVICNAQETPRAWVDYSCR